MDRRTNTTRPVALSSPSITATSTITIESSESSSSSSQQEQQQPEVLFLPLNRKKKKVSWKEGTVDNEFMQKKSSKKCCIFHKEKPFDEDDSDEDEQHSGKHPHDSGFCCKNHDEAGPSFFFERRPSVPRQQQRNPLSSFSLSPSLSLSTKPETLTKTHRFQVPIPCSSDPSPPSLRSSGFIFACALPRVDKCQGSGERLLDKQA
ncbi:hypothetical protein RJT34_00653 [Clitoria ternatea]|uniref:Uncharacterized protein n=1 Tax=Clitoria ternatea TaxID=43366 RepID=A0AAN9KHE3_CLITE